MDDLRPNSQITTNECIAAVPGYPWPVCNVCNKEVAELSIIYETHLAGHVFRVKCHGEYEDVQITDKLLQQCAGGKLEPGIAFTRKQIDGPVK